jgi:hypothetical protein
MERYVYAVASPGSGDDHIVTRYLVTNAGISFDAAVLTESQVPGTDFGYGGFDTPEAELLGDCFAWGSVFQNRFWVLVFNQNTGQYGNLLEFSLPDERLTISGLEFINRGEQIAVSGCGGEESAIYIFDISDVDAAPVQCQIEGLLRYSCTHLELARDGFVYLASDQGRLGRMSTSNYIISPAPSNILLNSGAGTVSATFYTLPDQWDEDNYQSVTGFPAAVITQFDINGLQVDPTIPPTPPAFYTCKGITLNTAGAAFENRIVMYSTSAVNGGQITGPGNLSYVGNWSFSFPNATNLLNLPGTNGTWLQSNPGNYAVELQVRDQCLRMNSRKGQLKVNPNPTPASIALQVNQGNGASCPGSQNIASPCLAAAVGGSFTLGLSTGSIEYYRIDKIEEVDCSSGQVLALVHAETANNTNFSEVVSARNFNNITVSSTGQQGYFAANGLNRCYKFSFTVGNICGESSAFTYVRFNTLYRPAPPLAGTGPEIWASEPRVYPNPAQASALLEFELAEASDVSIQLLEPSSGRVLATPFSAQALQPGVHRADLAIANLPGGIYLWRLETRAGSASGKMVKL